MFQPSDTQPEAEQTAARSRATVRDVAALAGVSFKTVSRVANGEQGVSKRTLDRVLAAMRELNYHRDMTAGSLRRRDRRSASIGLVITGVDNPFDCVLHRGAEEAANKRRVSVFAASTDEQGSRERSLVSAFIARRVDGLIVMPTGEDQTYLLPEMSAGTPVVMVDRPAVGVEADCVLTDHRQAARLAVENLIDHGHRRIAIFGDLSHLSSVRSRIEGYLEAMAAAGLEVDSALVTLDLHGEQLGFEAALRMIASDNPPTAIFSAQNVVTLGVIRALHARNLQHKIALVSFDDLPLADTIDPPLTVVTQDPHTIGAIAVERVFNRLENPDLPTARIIVPAALLRRGSGEIRPAELAAVGISGR
ncbi:MAG: LacI family transcriptional regulator [Propionibacteriaceae bacterium]|jgi:LacI family transcriptional regulator|nr:LacI family transcriptional regulator [Propionibacteriaceae bacterium]